MGQTVNLTYRQIITEFNSAANAHYGVGSFATGTIDYLDAQAVNKTYPLVFLRPLSSVGVVDKQRSLTFEMYVLDVPKLSDESPLDVMSNTELIAYDLISWFNQGTTQRQQTYNINITDLSPVNEAFQDRAFGWVATIDVSTPWRWDYCDFPQTSSSPSPVPTPSPTPTPTPTPPEPTYIQFNIDDIDGADCCIAPGNHPKTVYVAYTTGSWPQNIVGKTLYENSALTDTVFDSSYNFSPTPNSPRCIISSSLEHTMYYTVGFFSPPGVANNITINSASLC